MPIVSGLIVPKMRPTNLNGGQNDKRFLKYILCIDRFYLTLYLEIESQGTGTLIRNNN